jgi:hypothetical protein
LSVNQEGNIVIARSKVLICVTIKNWLPHSVFDMCTGGEFLTAKKLVVKMKEVIGFSGSKWLPLSTGFVCRRCCDDRKFLMKCSNVAYARLVFLLLLSWGGRNFAL